MRLGFVVPAPPFADRFAQRAFCARLIALRPAADRVRSGLEEATRIAPKPLLVSDPRSALIAVQATELRLDLLALGL